MIQYTEKEILLKLENFQNWKFDSIDLTKEFSFENYLDGIEFTNRVGVLSEKLNHHPEIIITWRKVVLKIHTHDLKSITELDFTFLSEVEKIGLK